MPCYKPLKGFKDYQSGGLTFDKRKGSQALEVACGQCLGCRVDYRLMWAIRIVHEASMWVDRGGNSWVTLTYRSPEECTDQQYRDGLYVPQDYSLAPSHVSKFIRALRKRNQHKKIRYFYCGEYGELGRPHYHVCLFNHQFRDQRLWQDNEGLYTYTSESLDEVWPWGFATVSELNLHTASYTAGYCFKKITGKMAEDHYLRCDEYGEAYWLYPEFVRMSTGRGKPSGIGAEFYKKFTSDIFPRDTCPVPGKGTYQLVPRYYQNILASDDPDMLAAIKETRQEFIKAHAADFTPERLQDKYKVAQANFKRRNQRSLQ